MRIALGADHAGVALKDDIKKLLDDRGVAYRDFGTESTEPVDYPDFAVSVARASRPATFDRGILFCGSGIGMAIAANKVPGVALGRRLRRSRRRGSAASTTTPTSSRSANGVTDPEEAAPHRHGVHRHAVCRRPPPAPRRQDCRARDPT